MPLGDCDRWASRSGQEYRDAAGRAAAPLALLGHRGDVSRRHRTDFRCQGERS